MKLTKGKISKLYHKKRQSVKRYKRGNKNIQNKTFRKKRHFDLSRLTLKNFKGGLKTLQNKRSASKAKQDAIIASIPPQERIPALATTVNDSSEDAEAVDVGNAVDAVNAVPVDEKQDINKDNTNPLTATPLAMATPSAPPLLASATPSAPPLAPGAEGNNKLEGAINVIIDEVVNRIASKMGSSGTLGGLQDPFTAIPVAAHTEQDDAAKSKKKSEDEQMAKGAEQIQNISVEPEPVLADANIVNKEGSMAKAELIPEGEEEEEKEKEAGKEAEAEAEAGKEAEGEGEVGKEGITKPEIEENIVSKSEGMSEEGDKEKDINEAQDETVATASEVQPEIVANKEKELKKGLEVETKETDEEPK